MRAWHAIIATVLIVSVLPSTAANAQAIEPPRFARYAPQPVPEEYIAPGPFDARCDRSLAGQLAIGAAVGAGGGLLLLYFIGRLGSKDPHIPADLRNRVLIAGAGTGLVRTGWNYARVCGTPVIQSHARRTGRHEKDDAPMRPLRYSINVTLDGCCDHRAITPDPEMHQYPADDLTNVDDRTGATWTGGVGDQPPGWREVEPTCR